MKKELAAIWNTLLANKEYTLVWTPSHSAENLSSTVELCNSLAKELGGQKKTTRCCGTKVDNWVIGDKVIGIFHTYNFTPHGVEENSEHFIIRLWTR